MTDERIEPARPRSGDGVRSVAVAAADGDIRLDRWFKRHFPTLTHGRLQKLLRTGQVRLDGKRAQASDRVQPGQTVRVPPLGNLAPAPAATSVAPPRPDEAKALQDAVIYRDADLIALDKPAGLAVQGGTSVDRHLDALLDALRFDAEERPRLVHRLDRDTSGVLVLARSARSAAELAAAFRAKTTRKIYWAIVVGLPKPREGKIDLPLAKLQGRLGERVMPDEDDGKPAVTRFQMVSHAGNKLTWLALMPITGRTHQLRAHCVALGTPILGDGKYGGRASRPEGVPVPRKLHLHARTLILPRPDGGLLRLTAPLPDHMKATWRFLGFEESEASGVFEED
ncbi:MAG TPA: RluA family pseudouridine synthase [Stellaceae bacterium]|nr:RluA family pseudouridine synthase [Stellaceae bacterium]